MQSTPLRLRGMAAALQDQLNTPDVDTIPFLDRLGLMVEHEEVVRGDRRLARRLHTAKLRLQASMANLDYGASRGLNKCLMLHLASCQWIRRQQNVIISPVPAEWARAMSPVHWHTRLAWKTSKPGTTISPDSWKPRKRPAKREPIWRH